MEPRIEGSQPTVSRKHHDQEQALLLKLEEAKIRVKSQSAFTCSEIDVDLLNSPLFQTHRDEVSSFGYSLRSFLLYGQMGSSIARTPGVFVERGDTTFALGLFLKDGIISAHLISPHGSTWVQNVAAFSKWLLQNGLVDRVYVRHINESAASVLECSGFRNIDTSTAWCEGAPFEDESFNHRLVNLDAIVAQDEAGGLSVKSLESTESSNFRNKFRLAYQRGENFLRRNRLEYSLRPYTVNDLPEVKKLVRNHFEILEQSGKAIGSCALDYELLLKNHLADDKRYVSLVGVLRSEQGELITSVFLGERTGSETGGLYCSITNRNPRHLSSQIPNAELTGFTALPQYALASLFGELQTRGWKHVDLGGSETEELDRFKRQMGAVMYETTWRVMT